MEDKKISLEEMGNTEIKLCEGLVIDSKPNIHTIRLMERRFGVPTEEFNKVNFKFLDNIISMIYLLALQHDKKITEEFIEEKLESEDLTQISKTLNDVFKVNTKKKASQKIK